MSIDPHSFASTLQSLRSQRRLSKSALARMVGVTTTCVWNWEEGNTEPRDDNLLALSKALDVPAAYLQFGAREPEMGECDPAKLPNALHEVIASAKVQIAKIAGIDPSKVKVSLDY